MDANPDALPSSGRALRIALSYGIGATLWILISDTLVSRLFDDPGIRILANVVKGTLFVLLTAQLIYLWLRRTPPSSNRARSVAAEARMFPGGLATALVVGLAVALLIAYNFEQNRTRKLERVPAIGQLAATSLASWLQERTAIVELFKTSLTLTELFPRWLADNQPADQEELQWRLRKWRILGRFDVIEFWDATGLRFQSGTTGVAGEQHSELRSALAETLQDGRVRRAGPYVNAAGQPEIAWVLSVTTPEPSRSQTAVIFRLDSGQALASVFHRWPDAAISGELTISRRVGDDIVDFRSLLAAQGPPQSTRERIAVSNSLSARYWRGEMAAGQPAADDSRGPPVIGVVYPVADTDWALVIALEQSELDAAAFTQSVWIGLVGLLALFLLNAFGALQKQRIQLAAATRIEQAQNERLQALNLLSAIVERSDDAIFAKDLEGRYLLFNRAAAEFVGKPAEAVLGQDDFAIFPPEQAEWLQELGQRVVDANRSLSEEEVLDTPMGKRIFWATKGPLHDSRGQIIGIFGISRDFTEIKRTEQALRASEQRLRVAQQSAHIGVWNWNPTTDRLDWTSECEALYPYSPNEFPGTYAALQDCVHPDDREPLEHACNFALERRQTFDCDFRVCLPNGHVRWINRKGGGIYDADGRLLEIFGVDSEITERKVAENTYRMQAEELAERNAELERTNRAMIGRELNMLELKQRVNELSLQLGMDPPYNLEFLIAKEPNATAPGVSDPVTT